MGRNIKYILKHEPVGQSDGVMLVVLVFMAVRGVNGSYKHKRPHRGSAAI